MSIENIEFFLKSKLSNGFLSYIKSSIYYIFIFSNGINKSFAYLYIIIILVCLNIDILLSLYFKKWPITFNLYIILILIISKDPTKNKYKQYSL